MLAPVTLNDSNHYLIASPVVMDKLNTESFDKPKDVGENQHTINTAGRAPVARVPIGKERGILRHYHRGGLIANISDDRFFWTGINQTRAVSEYRLLEWMNKLELPVPLPLGARVIRRGLYYTCDLITREVPDTQTLAERLEHHEVDLAQWHAIGKAIKMLHNHTVFHTDLNANNILLNDRGSVTLIDFDKCRRRTGTSWKLKNLKRLKRSLDKLTGLGLVNHFTADGWQALIGGYEG